jgi:hypothetical protein
MEDGDLIRCFIDGRDRRTDRSGRYPNRAFGIDAGQFEVPDDFDDALPPEIMQHVIEPDLQGP